MHYTLEEIEHIKQQAVLDYINSQESDAKELIFKNNSDIIKKHVLFEIRKRFVHHKEFGNGQFHDYFPTNHNQYLRKIPQLVTQEIEKHKKLMVTDDMKTRCYLSIMEDFRKEPLSKGQSLNMENVLNYIVKHN